MKTETILHNLGYMDTLAAGDSWIHRLDPRAKLLAAGVFIGMVMSFDKYQIMPVLSFMAIPIILTAISRLPTLYLIKRMLWVAPFAVMFAVFNPLLDRQILLQIGCLQISGGVVSFASIMLRFCLTVLMVLILVGTTGFYMLCLAMEKLAVPEIFVLQLMFLYRYGFVLAEESGRMLRAFYLRAPLKQTVSIPVFSKLLGTLFLRTTARSQRIYQAMYCRAFDGSLRLSRQLRWTNADTLFLLSITGLCMLFRFTNPPMQLGKLITGILL
ncbi:MAG TPA: cobalt ECF transporter T component CbiQ [Anaerohalosphaeraceae bacterium]|nr:cobalt ECF transporter T component CbiQ [Phycisphaerae bacterium]HOK94554.1 cobalt ECF transporter T component CbiQ [Anaerohalosphaeraceae bacterium]HOL32209.1 cobalt ECF transporter T component CbiQ [Anaerohalosphaeraceae bacterium]HOM76917.1 cobalt ECF transporter T component CbiQ [Anaerohalosphaeraceae bacterium]HPC63270.1 cobalt ECF transporter T component CbiQ [Anaerohalosphaeraceae bacterium]